MVKRPNDPQPGIFVIIGNPSEWPNFGYSIAPGVDASIGITPTLYTTSPDLRGFSQQKRDCFYDVNNIAYYYIHGLIICFIRMKWTSKH